jgi:hypothetical protein
MRGFIAAWSHVVQGFIFIIGMYHILVTRCIFKKSTFHFLWYIFIPLTLDFINLGIKHKFILVGTGPEGCVTISVQKEGFLIFYTKISFKAFLQFRVHRDSNLPFIRGSSAFHFSLILINFSIN